MNENRNRRIQELFVGALDLASAEQEEWLRSECGDDQAMLDEVLDLLRHDQPTADPLERGLDREVLSDVGLVQRQDQSGLHVRCPHCHHPIELVDEAELSDVVCESCGSSFSLIAADETKSYSTSKPTRIAHFDLIERVGIGAFGSVFKARDTKLDRIVAVKVPRKGQLTGTEAEQFLREARTAAQLKHPNIVAVHEVGREEDRVFIVSDFVDGVTLSDWLTGLQPTPRETAELCVTIARALQYAHEHGVIHRDLKPGNIILDRNIQPFIMDFGLAKREAAEITMTVEGQVLGTPAYMSPEQARGDAHSVDGTTDVYAVGVILFEMLTGERPFRGNLRMLLHQVLTEEAPSPRKYNASIPKDLETICLKCLEKTPARRYDTADNLADDLQRFIEHKPIDARPITRIERGWRWCKRKPVVASLSALLVIALTAGTLISSYFAMDANQKATNLSFAKEDADDQREIALDKAAEATKQEKLALQRANELGVMIEKLRFEKYANNMLLADSHVDGNQLDRAISLLEVADPAYRNWEWGYLANRTLPAAIEFDSIGFGLSHDGRLLAIEANEGKVVKILEFKTLNTCMTFPEPTSDGPLGIICGFSHDDAWLVTGGWGAAIRVWNVKTGILHRVILPQKRAMQYAALSTTAPLVAVSFGNESRIYNIETGELVHKHDVTRYHWSSTLLPGNSRTVLGSRGNKNVLDLETGNEVPFGEVRGGTWNAATVSADGKLFAVGSTDYPKLFVHDVDTLDLVFTLEHAPYPSRATIDSEHGVVITGARNGSIRVWDLGSRKLVHEFVAHSAKIEDIAMSADGRWLITYGVDQIVRVWPASWMVLPEKKVQSNWEVHWAPNGQSFALMASSGLVINHFDGFQSTSIKPPWKFSNTHLSARARFSWDSQSKRIALASKQGVLVIDAFTGERQTLVESSDTVVSVAFLPDDVRIAAGTASGKVVFVDSATGKKIGEIGGFDGPVSAICNIPNSEAVAAAGRGDSEISLLDFNTFQIVRRLRVDGQDIFDLDCDAQGRRLVAGINSSGRRKVAGIISPAHALVIDVESGEAVIETRHGKPTFNQTLSGVAINGDGTRMAVVTRERIAKVYDCDTGAQLLQLDANVNEFRDVDWSSDGKTLIAVSDGIDHIKKWRSADWNMSLAEIRAERQGRWDFDDPFGEVARNGEVGQAKLRELYAKSLQWEKALNADRKISRNPMTWEQVALLYQSGKLEEYRAARSQLLSSIPENLSSHLVHMFVFVALLEPLDEDLRPAIVKLAERSAVAKQPWEYGMVGKAMYRLGEYRQWYENLPEGSPLRDRQSQLLAIVSFQENPSPENRKTLEREIARIERGMQKQIKNGVIQGFWRTYVEQTALIKEARDALESSPASR